MSAHALGFVCAIAGFVGVSWAVLRILLGVSGYIQGDGKKHQQVRNAGKSEEVAVF